MRYTRFMISIDELTSGRLTDFFDYLALHLSENGDVGQALFQPLTREQSQLGDDLQGRFRNALSTSFGDPGWRKVWIATGQERVIAGHIDIRHYHEQNTKHRVILGMGVHSKFRKQRIGHQMLTSVIDYCRGHEQINWIDLQVLASNTPAIALYEKMGFHQTGSIPDMFRIAGASYGFNSMSLKVK